MAVEIKAPMILGIGAVLAGVFLLFRKKKPPGKITLYAGFNRVTYTGKEQVASKAFASIMDYLVGVFYFDAKKQLWEPVLMDTTIMIPNEIYDITVSQDCIWTF